MTLTVSDLTALAQTALPLLATNQAKAMLKAENIRSATKLQTVCATLVSLTAEQLAEKFGAPSTEAAPAAPAAKTKPAKEAATKEAAAPKEKAEKKEKKVMRQGAAPRKTASVVTAGPRGFRFGDVWNQSVMTGTGVAVAPSNINKLHAQAESLKVHFDPTDEPTAIAKKIAKKLAATPTPAPVEQPAESAAA